MWLGLNSILHGILSPDAPLPGTAPYTHSGCRLRSPLDSVTIIYKGPPMLLSMIIHHQQLHHAACIFSRGCPSSARCAGPADPLGPMYEVYPPSFEHRTDQRQAVALDGPGLRTVWPVQPVLLRMTVCRFHPGSRARY